MLCPFYRWDDEGLARSCGQRVVESGLETIRVPILGAVPCALSWKAQSSPPARMWCWAPPWPEHTNTTPLVRLIGNLPNIHPGIFSWKNPHSVPIVSQNVKLLIHFCPSLEIHWVSDGNEIENWEMLSILKYTFYYIMHCILLLRFFCHYVILERIGFFLHVWSPRPSLQGACST